MKRKIKADDGCEVVLIVQISFSADGDVLANDVKATVEEAVRNALRYGESHGFIHTLEESTSLGVVGVSVDRLITD